MVGENQWHPATSTCNIVISSDRKQRLVVAAGAVPLEPSGSNRYKFSHEFSPTWRKGKHYITVLVYRKHDDEIGQLNPDQKLSDAREIEVEDKK